MERSKLHNGANDSAGTNLPRGGGEWSFGVNKLILEGACSGLHSLLRTP